MVQDTLTKADQLPVAYAAPAPDAAELAKAAFSAVESLPVAPPAMVAPDVVEQQAQEPVAPVAQPAPVVRKAKIQKAQRKQPKPDAVASSKSPPATDLKACQLEEFDAFRYAFSLSTGCHS